MTATARARRVLRVRNLLFGAGFGIAAAVGTLVALTGVTASLWPVTAALLTLAVWCSPALWVRRLPLPHSRSVQVDEAASPELFALVRQLAAQLDVPAPTTIELSPDCDAWLEPRPTGSALIIGSPLLWWLRVTEIRGLLAPVVAGGAELGLPRIRAARRFVLRLDAADDRLTGRWLGPVVRRVATTPRRHAQAMERAVAIAAAQRAASIDPAGRIVAHEQLGLIVAAWDRVLTRLATPAWDLDCAPVALDAALVAALTELGSRDRLSHELSARLAERPACDLLEEPGRFDALVSALAADVFAGDTPRRDVGWDDYVPAVVEPKRRALAAAAASLPAVAPLVNALAKGDHRFAPHRAGGAPRLGVSHHTAAAARDRGVAITERPIIDRTSTERPGTAPDPAERTLGLPVLAFGSDTADDAALDAAAAAVECAAVDRGIARWRLDWLDGVVLRRSSGGVLPVSELVARAVVTGDMVPLRVALG